MGTLTVRHLISIEDDHGRQRRIIFQRWLPESEADVIIRQEDNRTGRLWMDRTCLGFFEPVTEESLEGFITVLVDKVYVDIVVSDVDDEILGFIYDERESPQGIHHGVQPANETYEDLSENYRQYGQSIQAHTLNIYNRFIQYSRNNKGQFWLAPYPFEVGQISSRNNHFSARAMIDDGEWFRWCPDFPMLATLAFGSERTYINSEDWVDIQEFVSGEQRPNLVLELLANADNLNDEGYRRSALIEWVAALEVALFRFSESPDTNRLASAINTTRIDFSSLRSRVGHLRFSTSFKYLIPILFSEEILPSVVLQNCNDAIDMRNAVAHGRQRDVNTEQAISFGNNVRAACEVLLNFTT